MMIDARARLAPPPHVRYLDGLGFETEPPATSGPPPVRTSYPRPEQVLVGPLDRARLAEAIERPAERAGITFSPGLVGRMAENTGGGDALPLLAHTLAELYRRAERSSTRAVTDQDYEALGGVVGALRQSADRE
jgi:hypothetical protein